MRLVKFLPAVLVLMMASPALAQDWIEYFSRDDFFAVNFPEQPRIEPFTYETEYGSKLPATRYIAERNGGTYMMSVVNMITTDRPRGRQGVELRGAMTHAAAMLRRTGEVTYDGYGEVQVIPGLQLQITLPDGKRNFVQLLYHAKRLYIAEAIVPPNSPPPVVFQASISITDSEGNELRYAGEPEFSFPDGRALLRRGNQPANPN